MFECWRDHGQNPRNSQAKSVTADRVEATAGNGRREHGVRLSSECCPWNKGGFALSKANRSANRWPSSPFFHFKHLHSRNQNLALLFAEQNITLCPVQRRVVANKLCRCRTNRNRSTTTASIGDLRHGWNCFYWPHQECYYRKWLFGA